MSDYRLTDAENAWIMRVWGAAPGRDRLAAEKRTLEQIIADAYQRGMVAGALEVLAAVEEAATPDQAYIVRAAREAVVRIENPTSREN